VPSGHRGFEHRIKQRLAVDSCGLYVTFSRHLQSVRGFKRSIRIHEEIMYSLLIPHLLLHIHDQVCLTSIGERRGVSKGVEDSRRPPSRRAEKGSAWQAQMIL
jgi:hypothetical protein